MASIKRKHRAYEATCDCAAYTFPHRLFGGKCDGSTIAKQALGDNICETCSMKDDFSCQVLDGIEETKHAACVREFIHYEGIRAPKSWQSVLTFHRGA